MRRGGLFFGRNLFKRVLLVRDHTVRRNAMEQTQVKDLMESQVVLIDPEATLQEAANKMKKVDCGFLPVGTDGALEGIITDRDIVIRAIAEGKNPSQEKVRDYMTEEVCCCAESDTIEDAAGKMSEYEVSRLVVEDNDGNACGVLTFGRIIRENQNKEETSEIVERATGKAN